MVGDVGVEVARRADVALVALALGELDLRERLLLVRDLRQQVRDAVEPRALLVVGLDDVPRRLGDVGVDEHLVLRARVVDPVRPRVQVGLGELPSAHRVVDPGLEAALLLLVAHREPVLDQDDAVLDEQPLEDRALAEEPVVLGRACRSPARARCPRGCTSCGRTARSRRRRGDARRSAGSTTGSSGARWASAARRAR